MRSWNNSGSLWHPIASTYTSITQRVTQARHVVSCNLVKASPKQSIRLQTHTTVFAHILKEREDLNDRRWVDRHTVTGPSEVSMPTCSIQRIQN
eukprot:COSAG02_NODE_2262_length_9317_cov_21.181927_12_plen_94_part_00